MVSRKNKSLPELYTLSRPHLALDFLAQGAFPDSDASRTLTDGPGLLDRARGALCGVAVGDALGRAVEGKDSGSYRIEHYEPRRGWKEGPVGTVTDDTQMTLWLAESLADCRGLNPEDIARRFTRERIRGIGSATREFVANYKDRKLPWFKSGVDSAGNGVAMRSAPLGIFYRNDLPSLKTASILQSMITHNNSMAVASGVVTAYAVAMLLGMEPGALSGLNEKLSFCRRLAAFIKGFEKDREYMPRSGGAPDTLFHRLHATVPDLLGKGATPESANAVLWSGAYVLESLPFALFCFLNSPGDFTQTLLDSVNWSKDSDTVGAIACGFAGAYNGAGAIGASFLGELEWRERIEGAAGRLVGAG